ncbi:hypothetical protein EDC01DRAFT_256525 [Geopyxis carbonaria]|nr:hypothetical protein EDC01DRAFT_256525 [Geopyxis carbonaria]
MAPPKQSRLLALPYELLLSLPRHLHNLEDHASLASTCRQLHTLCAATTPSTLLALAAASSRTHFRPSPHLLVAAVARDLGDWARRAPAHAARLARTFAGGIEALWALCLDPTTGCGLTMQRVRELHVLRGAAIHPVTDLVDKCVGAQWYSTPHFWDGGVSDAYTLDSDPGVAVFHWAIYGGLFGGDVDALLAGAPERMLGADVRLEFVKYCVPDWACYDCQFDAAEVVQDDGSIDARRLVQSEVGPYVANANGGGGAEGHQVALQWLLRSRRWNTAVVKVLERAGLEGFGEWMELRADRWEDEVEEELRGRQALWESAVTMQGLEAVAMVACASETWKGPDRWVDADGNEVGDEYRGSGPGFALMQTYVEEEEKEEKEEKEGEEEKEEDEKKEVEKDEEKEEEKEEEKLEKEEETKEVEIQEPEEYQEEIIVHPTRVEREGAQIALMAPAQLEKLRALRAKIAALPEDWKSGLISVGRQATLEFPYLMGDLEICKSGYVGGS